MPFRAQINAPLCAAPVTRAVGHKAISVRPEYLGDGSAGRASHQQARPAEGASQIVDRSTELLVPGGERHESAYLLRKISVVVYGDDDAPVGRPRLNAKLALVDLHRSMRKGTRQTEDLWICQELLGLQMPAKRRSQRLDPGQDVRA